MPREDDLVRQEQDHYLLARAPAKGCRIELDDLHEWLQQELISIVFNSEFLEPVVQPGETISKVRNINDRAKEINLKELPQYIKCVEAVLKDVLDKKYQHVLEVPSLLEREMIPLRNLAREVYGMRETLDSLEAGGTRVDDCSG